MVALIIAGSRDYTDYTFIAAQIDRIVPTIGSPVTEIVSGGARGVDACGERYAAERSIPVTQFPADWHRHSRAAGPIRNREMAEYADYLIAFSSGGPGTTNMIKTMRSFGKPLTVVTLP